MNLAPIVIRLGPVALALVGTAILASYYALCAGIARLADRLDSSIWEE